MFNWQPFLDLINSKDCTHEYNLLNFSDLEKVTNTFFKNTKYQSEKNYNIFLAKSFWSQCHTYITVFENLVGLVPTKKKWRSTSSQPQVDLIQFQVFTSTFNTFASGRPQVNLRSTWKSTSSAQVSFLGYNKRDVAILNGCRRL